MTSGTSTPKKIISGRVKVATESRSCRIGGRGVINPVRLMVISSDLSSPLLKYHPPGQPFILENSVNIYQQAIDIVTNPDTDFRQIVIDLAKYHPEFLVNFVGDNVWERQVIPLIRADQKMAAIKLCRNITGMTLVESKDAVNALMERLK